MKYKNLKNVINNMSDEELNRQVIVFVPNSKGTKLFYVDNNYFYSHKNQVVLNAIVETPEQKSIKHK